MNALADRIISLEVSINLRHLGGYRTRSGAVTRPDILRGGSLHLLEEPAVDALCRLGVRLVVDLRSTEERLRDPSPDFAARGVDTLHAPVFERDASPGGLQEGFSGYAAVYRRFLDAGRGAYRMLFEAIAETDGAVLFHCAAGKDRTGVAAALLLDIAGVSDDAIVADYAVSEVLVRQRLDHWRPRMSERGVDEATAQKLLASPGQDMVETLQYVRSRWGSAAGYLYDLGISEHTVDRIRRRTVT